MTVIRLLSKAVSRHGVFLILVAVGVALRVVTQFTYRPAILYFDSYGYLNKAADLGPSREPLGYSLFIKPFLAFHNLAVFPLLNHILALAMAVLIYIVLLRRGVWRWLAALATAPTLLSAYQLLVEQMIMSDVLFETLVVLGLALLTWRRRTGYVVAAAAGLTLGLAVLVRVVGQPLILAGGVYLLLAGGRFRVRLLTTSIFAAAFLLPVAGYAAYNASDGGGAELTSRGSGLLYARAAIVADCSTLSVPAYERQLCPANNPGQVRPLAGSLIEGYYKRPHSPANEVDPPPGMTRDEMSRDFALRVIRQQPLDFVGAIAADFLRGFSWNKTRDPGEYYVQRWTFDDFYPTYGGSAQRSERAVERYGGVEPSVNRGLSQAMRTYQLTVGHVPGPILFAALVLALVAAAGLGRARRSGLRAACFLWATTGAGLLLTATVYEFSWRYQLPTLVLLPAAGALAVTALLRPTRRGLA